MRPFFTLLLATTFALASVSQTVHVFNCPDINGDTVDLSQYYGKKLMIVNVASYCEYTPEYAPLETLYQEFKNQNFVILGFPSDDFDDQGGNDSEIVTVCNEYLVSFPIMFKIHCVTGDTAPIYKWLQNESLNGVLTSSVSWNFNKYLVDEAGHLVRHYDSPTSPLDTSITNWIQSPSVVPVFYIDTTMPSTPVCAGSTIAIPFNVSEPFNNGNSFIVQLSDSNGLFDTPLNIGLLNAITSDTIHAIIPADLVAANNYKIQVVSTDSFEYSNATTPIQVVALPATPSIAKNGDTLVCNLTSVDTVTYQWYLEGKILEGADSASFIAMQNGNYSVKLTNTNGCASDTASYQFKLPTTAGLNEPTINNIHVFPNPNNGIFTINSDIYQPAQLSITNMLGATLLKTELVSTYQKIDISTLTPDIYFLVINFADGSNKVERLVKE